MTSAIQQDKPDLAPLPKDGLIYYHYDDGKIRESRKEEVLILKIVPFEAIPEDDIVKQSWRASIKDCPYLYSPKTDYFIFGLLLTFPFDPAPVYARTVDGKWFSFLLDNDTIWGNYGTLDSDNQLTITNNLIK